MSLALQRDNPAPAMHKVNELRGRRRQALIEKMSRLESAIPGVVRRACLDRLYVRRGRALGTLLHVELHLLAFRQALEAAT